MVTLGPATESPSVLSGMKESGMVAARIHSIYGTLPDMARRIEIVRTLGGVDIFLDLKGPQVRLRCEEGSKVKAGSSLQVTFQPSRMWIDQPILPQLRAGMHITFGNGSVRGDITKVGKDEITLKVTTAIAPLLLDNIDVHIPDIDLTQLPPLSERDKKVVQIGIEKHVQGFAPSYVRDFDQLNKTVAIVEEARQKVMGAPPVTYLIKIEDATGVQNLPAILMRGKQAGLKMIVMVARGDLFNELPPEELPIAQQYIINRCQENQVPVMVATGIFSSMKEDERPARAEYMDLFQICMQGADWVLLSDEVANGMHPVELIATLNKSLQKFGASFA